MRCLRCHKTVKTTNLWLRRKYTWADDNRGSYRSNAYSWKWQICPTCMKYAKKHRFILEKDNDWSCN